MRQPMRLADPPIPLIDFYCGIFQYYKNGIGVMRVDIMNEGKHTYIVVFEDDAGEIGSTKIGITKNFLVQIKQLQY